jgi:hypothetical protein
MKMIMEKAGAEVACEAAILTEGERAKWITSLPWDTYRYLPAKKLKKFTSFLLVLQGI